MTVDIDQLYEEVPQAHHANFAEITRDHLRVYVGAVEAFRESVGKEREATRLLEAGCGVGRNAYPFAELDYEVFGLDSGRRTVDYLLESDLYPNFKPFLFDLQKGDFDSLPDRLDVIMVPAILEHIEDPLGVMHKLLDRANPDCLIVGDVPNSIGPAELGHDLRRAVKRRWGDTNLYKNMARRFQIKPNQDASDSATLDFTPHIHPFRIASLRKFLVDLSLEEIRIENSAFLTGTPILHKLFFMDRDLIQRADVRFSKWLPQCMATNWYFSGRRRPSQ